MAATLTPAPVFDIQPDEKDFLAQVQEFVDREVAPFTRDWEEAAEFPASIWPKLGKVGLLKILISREWGGLGLSTAAYCEAIRILAKADPALAMNLAAWNGLSGSLGIGW